jgi:hypothetical protein
MLDENDDDANEPLIAYVHGDDTPPDFAALAAAGFEVVCLDRLAPWFSESMIRDAKAHGLLAVGFPMAYRAPAEKRDEGRRSTLPLA